MLDAAATAIEERSHQPSLAIYVAMERLLISAANVNDFNHQQFAEVCDFFGDDLDRPTLKLQLTTSMKELFKDTQCHTVKEVVAVLEVKRGCLDLLGEVDKLVHLFLVIPGSSATAEISFSTMRRLKTHLRTTITATRLNSVVLLHSQRDYNDDLSPENIVSDVVNSKGTRKVTFG